MTQNPERTTEQVQKVNLAEIWDEMERTLVEMYRGGIHFTHPSAVSCVVDALKKIRAKKLQSNDDENTEVSGDEAMETVLRANVAFRMVKEKALDTVHQLAMAIEVFRLLINEGQETSGDSVSSTLQAVQENLGENATISNSQQADRSHVEH